MNDAHSQSQYQVRFDWGIEGADAIGADIGVVLVVDVLSFCTAVDVATSAGLEVIPASLADAERLATEAGAAPAGERGAPVSLSATALAAYAASTSSGSRVVLPSPNGSALSAALMTTTPVVAVSLRNRRAVARWVLDQQSERGERFPVAVIAAGERRTNAAGTRFAVEDLLGAGAVIDALADLGIDYYSPEAAIASTAFLGCANATRQLVTASASGRELVEAGFVADVELAVQVDVSSTVPVAGPIGSGEFGFRSWR